MTRFEWALGLLIFLACFCLVMLLTLAKAHAHDPYTGRIDPKFLNGCCGGEDCAILKVEPGVLTGDPEGYRVTLTIEQAQKINPYRKKPVDTLITWDRVQPSWDGNYHICLRPHDPTLVDGLPDHTRGSAYCFWAPPNA